VSSAEALRPLLDAGAEIQSFRDISGSAKLLFEESA
jgi:hypothetical protein